MKTQKRWFSVILVIVPLIVIAGGKDRAGTSAAPELTVPVGARYLATAGSAIATAQGLEAVYWNPAGVDLTKNDANAMFSYRSYIADIGVSFASVSGKFGFGTIALSLRSFGIGDIRVTTENAPDGTGEILNPSFFVVGLTYSKKLSDRTSIGVTANMISESFGGVSASGMSFDMGVQYQQLVGIEGLAIGIAVKNIGPSMQYGGSGLYRQAQGLESDRGVTYYKVGVAEFDLPSTFELGMSYRYPLGQNHELHLSTAYQNNNFALDEYRVGVEYTYSDLFHLRGGYIFTQSGGGDSRVPTLNVFKNYTLGFGLNLASVSGVEMVVDFAYVPGDLFKDNSLITVNIGF